MCTNVAIITSIDLIGWNHAVTHSPDTYRVVTPGAQHKPDVVLYVASEHTIEEHISEIAALASPVVVITDKPKQMWQLARRLPHVAFVADMVAGTRCLTALLSLAHSRTSGSALVVSR